MRASRTLGISVVAAALGGTVFLGAQAVHADGHQGSIVRASAAAPAAASPANDPWD